jgi:predicted flavoprotein YhiN
MMNKERLEWVMSGLKQYKLTKNEDQFVKSALGDFDQKQMLTAQQEERIEILYKEKSKLKPNKSSSDYFSFKETTPKKARIRRLLAKDVLIAS